MSLLIESLKRQYKEGKVAEERIRQMEVEGKITFQELMYILKTEND